MSFLVTVDILDGTLMDAVDINDNMTAVKTVVNGSIDNGNIAAAANIVPSKLAGYPSNVNYVLRGDGSWGFAVVTALPPSSIAGFPSDPTKVLKGDGSWAQLVDADIPAAIARDSEVTAAVSSGIAAHVALADPHTGYQQETEKGAANGYAPLGSDSKVPAANLPTLTAGPDPLKEDKANKGVASGYAPLDATSKVPLVNLPALAPASDPLKEDKANKGAASGYAPLGADSKVPAANLPASAGPDVTKEDKVNKGAASGYAPLDATSKVPLANLPTLGGSTDLSYDGDWVAGTYQEGDVVVKDGVTFMCVGGPTTVAPDASLWGSVIPGGPVVPAIQNGKWIKGVGGAMVWSDVVALGGGNASAANTDLAAPTAPVYEFQVTSGGGSVRSIGSWPSPGSARVIVHNWVGSTPFTLIAGAGGLPGGQTALGLRDNANLVLGLGESVEFAWDGSWREVSRNLKLAYGTTLPTSPYDGQEAILVDSLTAPTYHWRFRYNAGHSVDSFKWEFIGGNTKVIPYSIAAYVNLGAFTGWAGGPPQMVAPRSGNYHAILYTQATAAASILLRIGPGQTGGYTSDGTGMTLGAGTHHSMSSAADVLSVPAGDSIQSWWNQPTANAIQVANVRLTVVPIRVA